MDTAIVAIIVAAAALYLGRKFLKPAGGKSGGCSSCGCSKPAEVKRPSGTQN